MCHFRLVGWIPANSVTPPTGNFHVCFGRSYSVSFSRVRASFIFGYGFGFSGVIVVWEFFVSSV